MWSAGLLLAASAAAGIPDLKGYKVTHPERFDLKKQSGSSALYEVVLPNDDYTLGRAMLVSLNGTRREIGRAYAELIGNETADTLTRFATHLFPNSLERAALFVVVDWLWDSFLAPHTPPEFLEELEGMKEGNPSGLSPAVDVVSRRFNTLANLPADPQNIATMLENELEKGLPAPIARAINTVINGLMKCTWCDERGRLPSSTGCDSFGVWGSRTKGGQLFSSRNLDWAKDTGISHHKLVTVITTPGAHPHATFGYASGLGALAGMSSAGMTVSEMNLDNSRTTFDGPPFPLRLRMVLERAGDLETAKAVWGSANNTDSMNYLIASAKDTAAMAMEAMRGFTGIFEADSPIEAAATCIVGTKAGGTCGTGVQGGTAGDLLSIGKPLKDAVFRSNHAFHPEIMPTQEPLFNDTTFRYNLLHDVIAELGQANGIDHLTAVRIVATLGIKGPDFYSCDASQFNEGSNVMSIAYAPSVGAGAAYTSWEDGTGSTWRPAACSTYIYFDFSKWW